MYDFISVVAVIAETWKPTRRPRCGKTLVDHEISFVFRPQKSRGACGPWASMDCLSQTRPAEAKTGPAGLLRPLTKTKERDRLMPVENQSDANGSIEERSTQTDLPGIRHDWLSKDMHRRKGSTTMKHTLRSQN